ncbi:MAG: D-aminoacylase [Ignavibacteriae bacterium]|nr:D-aminoacylase [Ignavibacteriota bacterium]
MRTLFAFSLLLLLGWQSPQDPPYDFIIKGARIIDGSGNPWYAGDIGITDGKIAAIGRLDTDLAKNFKDVHELIVAPGFIDVHTHVERSIREQPTADNYLFDGVTSIITGNCGGSVTDLDAFFAELRDSAISLNVATLIGHNSVRRAVMGLAQRDPTPEEQTQMEELVDTAMRSGAVGFSTGLIYLPGTYSKTPEVLGMAKAASRRNGVYASHIRNEGNDEQMDIFGAIAEAINIGREAHMPVEISHFKVSSKKLWGQSVKTIGFIEKARAEGLDVTVDQYPYTASSTNLGVLAPSWALADGDSAMKMRFNDPATRKKIVADMKKSLDRAGRNNYSYAFVARCRWDSTLEGKSISQINKELKRKATLDNEIKTVLEMIEKGGASMIYHTMGDEDVKRIMQYPYSMVASDGGVIKFGDGMPHPRNYGTNARVLGHFVREKKILRLEEAIRKMTSLPAQRFGFTDRGLIRPGMWADLVVFDEKTVTDRSTFEKPHAYSTGIHYVFVNGIAVINHESHTGARPGQIILGPATEKKISMSE